MPGILAHPFERFQPFADQRLTKQWKSARKGSIIYANYLLFVDLGGLISIEMPPGSVRTVPEANLPKASPKVGIGEKTTASVVVGVKFLISFSKSSNFFWF